MCGLTNVQTATLLGSAISVVIAVASVFGLDIPAISF